MSDSTLISVRVSRELAKRLERLADALDRSKSWVAAQAIEEFVTLEEWQVKAIHEGLRDADAGRLFDHQEARKKIAGWKKRAP
jgi:RHH-type rel operon transcriptional repressor/antitoxin RelB